MKFYADDEMIFEVPDYMIDVLSHYENREDAEIRFQHVVARILQAHCISFMKRFRKDWKDMQNQPEKDEDFVKFVKASDGYMGYKEKMLKATTEAKKKSDIRKAENETKKKEKLEALQKERAKKNAIS